MILKIDIGLLPLLFIPISQVMLSLLAYMIYQKTNIKRDLYISLSFGGIGLCSLLLYSFIGKTNIPFWSSLYQYACIIVVFQMVVMTYFSKSLSKSSFTPILILSGILLSTLFIDVFFAGQVVCLSFLSYGVWVLYRAYRGASEYVSRGITMILLSLFLFIGQWFPFYSGIFIFSLLIVVAMLIETHYYYTRVVNMLRSAGINSMMDPLTNLYNKGFLLRKTEKLINEQTIDIIFCDIDNFKNLNDTKGHEYGDKVLIEVGAVLKRELQYKGFVCRFGGEEIVGIVIEGNSRDIGEKFRKCVESEVGVTISVGIASSREILVTEKKGTALIKKADERMYVAKKTGKNRVVSDDNMSDLDTKINNKIKGESKNDI
ncbi:GGDEF domain-containing protein [Viridibacillus arvi]|uniref:GGDEF domain-containing protein n=1 Tax=Viridibacillus arvi TaxID=263475 RepID=UPI0034CE7C49